MEAQGRLGSEWESDWELQIAGKAHIIARKNAPIIPGITPNSVNAHTPPHRFWKSAINA